MTTIHEASQRLASDAGITEPGLVAQIAAGMRRNLQRERRAIERIRRERIQRELDLAWACFAEPTTEDEDPERWDGLA